MAQRNFVNDNGDFVMSAVSARNQAGEEIWPVIPEGLIEVPTLPLNARKYRWNFTLNVWDKIPPPDPTPDELARRAAKRKLRGLDPVASIDELRQAVHDFFKKNIEAPDDET